MASDRSWGLLGLSVSLVVVILLSPTHQNGDASGKRPAPTTQAARTMTAARSQSNRSRVTWTDPIGYIPPAGHTGGPYHMLLMDPRRLSHFPEAAAFPRSGRLILTTLQGDGVPTKPFIPRYCESLRRTGSDAMLLLFANLEIADALREKLQRWKVAVVGFPKLPTENQSEFWISSLRFLLYRLALQRTPPWVNTVMITDFYDVYFQLDPFPIAEQQLRAAGRQILASAERCTMGVPDQPDNGLNERWVSWCFGDNATVVVRNRTVLNSGTVIGLRDAMEGYIIRMDEVFRSEPKSLCSHHGVDQGVHNFLMYSEFLDSLLVDDADAPMMMIGNGVKDWLFSLSNGRLLTRRGDVAAVVHQPNRCWPPVRFWHRVDEWPASVERVCARLSSADPSPFENSTTLKRFVERGSVFQLTSDRTCDDVEWPPHLAPSRHL